MVRNYLITAFRNLLRNPVYTLINIFGLSIGITCSLLIMIYIRHEFSYDKFHTKKDRLYRVVFEMNDPDGRTLTPQMTAPVGPDIGAEFPEVVSTTRLSTYRDGYFTYDDKTLAVDQVLYADSSFFSMFSFELVAGDPARVLAEPYSLVMGEETARMIFGNDNPVGKVVRWNNADDLVVTGIVKYPPANSHLQFSSLVSFSSFYRDKRLYMDWNGGMQYYHYIELLPDYPAEALEAKLPDFMYKHINYIYEPIGASINASLQSIRKIHFSSGYSGELGSAGSKTGMIIYSLIAFIILLIACINFINLTTARSAKRAKEVGLRKVLGAERKNIIRQFLGESVFISLLALVISLILIEMILPGFSQLTGRDLDLYQWMNLGLLFGIPVFIVMIGILAGSFPAFYLSAFKPVRVLKGLVLGQKSWSGFRDALVLVQFTVSVVLIISTLVVYSQLDFIRSKDMGYDTDNLLVLKMTSDPFKAKFETLKNELSNVPGVIISSATSEIPGRGFTSNGYRPEGFENWLMFHAVEVDYNYIAAMGLNVVEGRGFSEDFLTDRDACMVNTALVRHLNWTEPVGKILHRESDMPVIGVVNDFHFASLHEEIAPLVITMKPYMGFDYLLVRFRAENTRRFLSGIEKAWESVDPDEPFEYHFYDEVFDDIYNTERKMSSVLLYIAVLAIIIACMGLFGLALYNTEARTREIGVRKVFGSSSGKIIFRLSGNFTRWVLIANIFAWPVAYIIFMKYMQNYAFRISFPLWIFLAASAGTYLIALITISFQSIRAGNTNPADVLRYE